MLTRPSARSHSRRRFAGSRIRRRKCGLYSPPHPHSGIDQRTASSLCPPQGSIWRGLSNGSWQCHLHGFKRRSFLWSGFGIDEACRQCLKHMWHLHLASQGCTIAQCPEQALFSAGDAAAAAPAAIGHSHHSSPRLWHEVSSGSVCRAISPRDGRSPRLGHVVLRIASAGTLIAIRRSARGVQDI